MMNSKKLLCAVLIALGIELTQQTVDMANFNKCRGVDLDIAEEHLLHMNDCLKEAGATDVLDVSPDKMPCFGKCVFVKKGLLDTNGHPHKEKIKSLIQDHLPKEVHEELNKKMESCLHPNTTEMIDAEDDSCITYVPVMMCMHISFMEECEKPTT